MNYQSIISIINLILFIVSAYYIKKSESCPCPDADASRRNYLLYFSYFEIIFLSVRLALGATFSLLLLSFPVLHIIPIFAVVGGIVWSIFTIQHVNAMKKCKCPKSQVEELTQAFAILRLIAGGVLILLVGDIILRYTSMNDQGRKEYMIGFKKAFIQRLKKQSKN